MVPFLIARNIWAHGRVCVGLYSLQGDKVVRTDRLEMVIDGASTEIAELVGKKRADIDFILPNDDDLTECALMGPRTCRCCR